MWRNTVGLIVMLTLGILVVPRASHAQQPTTVPRIGILMSMAPEMGQHLFDAFRHGCASRAGSRARTSSWSRAGQRGSWNGLRTSRRSWSDSRWISSLRRIRQGCVPPKRPRGRSPSSP
jgi:hypothetical protein